MASIVVHGGAGSAPDEIQEKRRPVLRTAAEKGMSTMSGGKTATEAVEEAVRVLESSPVFNAGLGAVLTIEGTVEMDAAIMNSRGQAGAVATLENVEHPVSVARLVQAETDHTLLAGKGLERFVKSYEEADFDPITDRRRENWEILLDKLEEAGYDTSTIPDPRHWGHCKSIVREVMEEELHDEQGTVGAVALDGGGRLAAATSTGGTNYKLPGRVGDTPIIGSGTYACKETAISATGDGEAIMRTVLAREGSERVRKNGAEQGAHEAISYATRHNADCGLIAVDREGEVGSAFNTEMMETHSIQDASI